MSEKMDAAAKVWCCSDIIERILTFLDPLSIKRLYQSGVVDKKALKKSLSSKIWAGLIKRSSYGGGGVLVLDDVKDHVAILKFLKLEEPGSFLLPLLHHICKSFPAERLAHGVTLNHPSPTEPRKVSLLGFLLLEEAESSFGTSIQNIEKIEARFGTVLDEPHLSALSSRIMRQVNPVGSTSINRIKLGGGLQSAQAFSILLQADRVYVGRLLVSEAIEEEGWRILAKAIRPGSVRSIWVTKDGLAQGKREPIKHLFDAGGMFRIFKTLEDLQAENWEASLVVSRFDNWSRMERVLNLSEERVQAEY